MATLTNQIPGLCRYCKYRGAITYIDPDDNVSDSNELVLKFFCKALALNVGRKFDLKPNIIDHDSDGNIIELSSQIVNCTEFVLNPTVKITGVSYDNAGNTTISYSVAGLPAADSLELFSVADPITPITTIGGTNNGTGSYTYVSTLAPDVYGFYGYLLNNQVYSNRRFVTVEAPVVVLNEGTSYNGLTGLTVNYSLLNSSGADNIQVKVDGGTVDTIVAAANGIGLTHTTGLALAPGNHTILLHLVTAALDSNPFIITV